MVAVSFHSSISKVPYPIFCIQIFINQFPASFGLTINDQKRGYFERAKQWRFFSSFILWDRIVFKRIERLPLNHWKQFFKVRNYGVKCYCDWPFFLTQRSTFLLSCFANFIDSCWHVFYVFSSGLKVHCWILNIAARKSIFTFKSLKSNDHS